MMRDGFGLETVAKLMLALNTAAMTTLCQVAVTQLAKSTPVTEQDGSVDDNRLTYLNCLG